MIDMGAAGRIAGLGLEEVRRLASIGFHGVLNGAAEPALRLFEGLTVLRPHASCPRIGSALALLALGHPEEAARVLERAQALQPDDDQVRVFLGMTLCFADRAQHGCAVLAQLARGQADMPAARLARRLLRLPAAADRGALCTTAGG